jgi:hypothetical protein
MNPNYDECLILDVKSNVKQYFTLYANRKNLQSSANSEELIKEDDCLIAYSDKSQKEIVDHRNKLVSSGYYRPTELYIRIIPNFLFNKKIPEDVLIIKDFN